MASIRSNRVVFEGETRPAVVSFDEGVVTAVAPKGVADFDFGDLVIMPGLVDSHVHVNEPGRADWEGFPSATQAAAAGGTTTIVDMPLNSIPPTTTVKGLVSKRDAADGGLWVDVAFWGGLVPGSMPEIAALVAEGVCGFKSFLVDSGVPEFPSVSPAVLEDAMSEMAGLGVPALIHAEDPQSLRMPTGDATSYATYLASRPVESEVRAVEMVAELAHRSGARAHILHVSSGDAVRSISRSSLSGETCPHYLTFAAEECPSGATQFKCAPPIREAEHREALWDGLLEGSLAMVVSDHSPAPADLKEVDSGDFIRAWGGISSLQLRLPVVWTGAVTRGVEVSGLVEWLASAPARLAGLDHRKGSIAAGMDADFVIWDPDGLTEVHGSELYHRHPMTPYEGMTLRGRVVLTLLGGRDVFEDGTRGMPRGRMLRRR